MNTQLSSVNIQNLYVYDWENNQVTYMYIYIYNISNYYSIMFYEKIEKKKKKITSTLEKVESLSNFRKKCMTPLEWHYISLIGYYYSFISCKTNIDSIWI